MSQNNATMAAMFFLFNPIAFYSPMIMGQYDTLCLFFMLWALYYYIEGDLNKFSFVIGISMVFKFFSLLVFVPLLLLSEKRILKLIRYGLTGFWLYIPTTLLFWGRTGNAAAFTHAMIERLFAVTMPVGMREVPVFVLIYAIIVFACFLYTPSASNRKYMAVYISMVVFTLLFNYIYWHPQWLILMIPFTVITTFVQKNKAPWFYLDIVLCIGFFSYCFFNYSNQCGAILFDGGIIAHVFNTRVVTSENWVYLRHFLRHIPYIRVITPVCFTGAILSNIIFKFPIKNGTVSDIISNGKEYDKIPDKVFLYGIFFVGFVCAWAVPSFLELINALGII